MAQEQQSVQIPRVKLGTQGLEVSKLGFGCMGLSGAYNDPVPDDVGISIFKHAFNKGITFLDTSDIYGPQTNEILVGKALKQLPREKVQLATKFGIVTMDPATGVRIVNGTPEYVRASVEASLKRLDVDYIDLCYQHRVDTRTPIEDTIGELKKLVEEGKIKYIASCEASPETMRAHAVHPITAVQMECYIVFPIVVKVNYMYLTCCFRNCAYYYFMRPRHEKCLIECVPIYNAGNLHGIGIVPCSPLGHALFGGRAVVESLHANSFLHGCTAAQLALAWVLHQGDDVAPIPGTTKTKNLDINIDSLRVKLTEDDLKERPLFWCVVLAFQVLS
ncbi:hypothetical protein PTKIN_Ptkin06aG0190000 [Pterospermum kingtungense]